MKTKKLGPYTFKIDRPKGTVKKWGKKTFVYPCDYGYFPGRMGEDAEGLDAFVGDDPNGHIEVFQKLTSDGQHLDETKFVLGVDDSTRHKIYQLYGNEVWARRCFEDWDEVEKYLKKCHPKKKDRYMEKSANLGELFPIIGGENPVSRELANSLSHPGYVPVNSITDAVPEVNTLSLGGAPLTRSMFLSGPKQILLGTSNVEKGKAPFLGGHAALSHIAAHEVGHALNDRNWWGKALHHPIPRAVLPGIGGLASSIGFGLSDSDNAVRNSAITRALLDLPTLLGEGLASYRGDKLLRTHNASRPELRAYRGNMAKAFGSYALQTALNTGGAALATHGIRSVRHALRHRQEEKEHKKEAVSTEWIRRRLESFAYANRDLPNSQKAQKRLANFAQRAAAGTFKQDYAASKARRLASDMVTTPPNFPMPESHTGRNLGLAAAAIGIPALGYAAYKHFKSPEEPKTAAIVNTLAKFGFDANAASVAKKMQDIFLAADRKPVFTGEESMLSNPVSQPISG